MKKKPAKLGVHGRATFEEFRKTLLIQVVCTVLIALISCTYSIVAGYSALLGGAIYLLPNTWAAWKLLTAPEQQNAGTVVRQAYVSQIWKMAMTTVGFALVFVKIQELNPFSIFSTYIGLHLVGLYIRLRLNKRFQKL
ncbi:ATP synthase subunit I [Aliamphritea spongicola]|uniref:ATP synthase subunit I n=1 Tax=Aliamphritea spongicola TaxID=707589 RepID=UPI00196A76BB|nr:ATP synthase subunit I [Aliamphritea spongicola]MBN3561951.1 ATP synthase subunit I [Aliamphritea spongicola]